MEKISIYVEDEIKDALEKYAGFNLRRIEGQLLYILIEELIKQGYLPDDYFIERSKYFNGEQQ